MKSFEEYIESKGYSWSDFDRCYEMEGLIESYANDKLNEAADKMQEKIYKLEKAGFTEDYYAMTEHNALLDAKLITLSLISK